MKLIVLHHNADLSAGGSASGGLRIALSGEPLAGVVLDALSRSASQIGISLPSRGQAVAVSPVSPVRDASRRDALRWNALRRGPWGLPISSPLHYAF